VSTLCLDFGNSRVKWGLRTADGWSAQGALTLAELDGLSIDAQRIVACNVAGTPGAEAAHRLAARLAAPLAWLRAEPAGAGVTNGYANPGQLGADRWAALIGARALHGGPCLVVMSGTATTVDVLDAAGHFRGGLILPGLDLMRTALAQNTAGLPLACGKLRDLPDNTDDAIASGCLMATLGAIERMFRPLADEPGALCLLSGGAADVLAPHLSLPLRRIDQLVLEGLAVWSAAATA
jgi:type III pantothenate kinase